MGILYIQAFRRLEPPVNHFQGITTHFNLNTNLKEAYTTTVILKNITKNINKLYYDIFKSCLTRQHTVP